MVDRGCSGRGQGIPRSQADRRSPERQTKCERRMARSSSSSMSSRSGNIDSWALDDIGLTPPARRRHSRVRGEAARRATVADLSQRIGDRFRSARVARLQRRTQRFPWRSQSCPATGGLRKSSAKRSGFDAASARGVATLETRKKSRSVAGQRCRGTPAAAREPRAGLRRRRGAPRRGGWPRYTYAAARAPATEQGICKSKEA